MSIKPVRFRMKRPRRLSLSERLTSIEPTPDSPFWKFGALEPIWPTSIGTADAVWLPRLEFPEPTSGSAPKPASPAATAVGAVPIYFFNWFRFVWLMFGIAASVAQPAAVGAWSAPGVALWP